MTPICAWFYSKIFFATVIRKFLSFFIAQHGLSDSNWSKSCPIWLRTVMCEASIIPFGNFFKIDQIRIFHFHLHPAAPHHKYNTRFEQAPFGFVLQTVEPMYEFNNFSVHSIFSKNVTLTSANIQSGLRHFRYKTADTLLAADMRSILNLPLYNHSTNSFKKVNFNQFQIIFQFHLIKICQKSYKTINRTSLKTKNTKS